MSCEQETFISLLRNAAHWEFELFLMLVFDVVIGAIAWPWIRKLIHKHGQHKECSSPSTSEGLDQ